MNKIFKLTFAIFILCAPALAAAQVTVEELEQQCDEWRARELARLSKVEIAKCTAEKAMEPAKCESYYKDYGNITQGPDSKNIQRMLDDLAPCVQAREMKSKTREGTVSTTKRGETTTDLDKTMKELTTTPEQAAVESIVNQGKVTPTSRDSTLGTEKRDADKTESSSTGSLETDKSKSSRDSTLTDSNRDSTGGTSTR